MSRTEFLSKMYYRAKPFIPRQLQITIRRGMVALKRRRHADTWPIFEAAGRRPENWQGWPDGKQFALVLTHDVDTATGQDRCVQLLEMERNLGFSSSFNFVPRRYEVSAGLRRCLVEAGYEVGVHGLYHDGKYYESRETFRQRATLINGYLREWEAVGFRSPSMLHNLEWILDLDIEYDASTFDTDPFEPQPDGVGTIFPFQVEGKGAKRTYIELPYTLPQDFTLFVLMKEKTIDIWKRKLDWIAAKGGMALLNTHPDYMIFEGRGCGNEEYPAAYYEEFLEYAKRKYEGRYLQCVPRSIASLWKDNVERGVWGESIPSVSF